MSFDRRSHPLTQRVALALGAALLLASTAHAAQATQSNEPADVCPVLKHIVDAIDFKQLHGQPAAQLPGLSNATGSIIQAAYATAANYSSPTFANGRPADLRHVCIEVNQTVSVGDFVPALQLALDRRGIRSDVYNPGISPAGCKARIVYNAAIDHGRRSFSDESIQYVSIIDLTLIHDGRILVTARYQTGGLNTDRFSCASTKLSGLIDRMVVDQTGFAREPPQTIQTSQAN